MKTQYTQTKNALLADKTLLTAENQQQAANIDRAYNAAVASLADNQTPNAQAIADAVTTGKANIQAQFVPGDSIGDQQKAAIDAVNQATNDADNLIGQDPTLTTDNVNQQVINVSAAAKAIIAKISAATDAQTIANAIVNVEERLASLHVPGQSVDTQKGAAGTAVNGAGDQAKQGIQGDPTLNQQTKDAQKAAVNNIVSKAIAAINAETLAAKIDADKQQAIADINAQHKQGQQISDQQTNAIAAITQEANTVKTAIDQDDTLDSSTKDSQKGNVDQAVQQATKNINAATTADTIAAAQTTGINSIDAAHLPGTGISAQRQAALDKVQAEANSVKAAIQADNTLDTATVTSQLANVDTALSAARAAIQAETVTNSDEIGHARDAGIANIDQQYQPGLALSQQQGNAQAQLATYAGSNTSSSGIWHDIDSDVTLTNDQKSQQEQALSNALDSAKTTIGSATNAQAIEDAVANAKTAMTQAHVIGAPVDQQRQLTYRAFLSYAQDVQAVITLDPNLTAAEKQTQMNNLNVVIQNAQSSFAASQITNAQQIAEAKTATSSALAAVTAVQQAGDAETIVEQLAAGIKNIDGAHSSGTAVATQQANAIAILTQTAKDTKKAITNDVSLLEATRASQRSQIDTDLQTVIAAINGISSGDATAADQIQADQTQWNKTIANDHVSGTALAEQKASQKTALENYAGSDSNHQGVWSAIDTDVTLTDADKATQKANLASALSTYEGDIDAAPDAQTLSDLIAKANSAMDASHSAGVSLADRLVAANKQLASKVVQVKAQIAGDPTLTDADVISQSNAVDTAVKELQNELNNDQNAQAIVNTLTNGLTTIAGKYQQQKSLADRRTDATNAINQAVTQAKTAIDTDPTLNKADRTAQEAAVDQAVSTMTDSLNQANTAQKILNVQNTLVQAAAGVHSAGQPIADQQKAANADLEKTADQINQAITADVNLTNAQKTAERANVASALNTAEQAINGLNDAQQILDEKSRQTITIQSQHPLPRQLSDLISDARNAFQTEYSGIHQVIQNDNTLNNSSRASQFAALSNALQAANDSLTGVNNAQQLADVQDKGMKQIDSSHVVGTPLSQQIQAAKDQLTSLADKLNTAVMNDVNLLDSSKTTREGLLTATLSKYTNQLDAANQPNSTANGQTVLDLLQAATTALNNDRTSDDGNGGSQDQPLADQIAAAVKQVSQKSVAVQNLINGDNSLVQSMIDDQTASNTSISNQAITDIKAAVNAQGLANRLSKALQDLNGVYQTNPTSLDDQKAQAIKDFNALYGTVQGQIKNDTGLTSSQKATQLANLDQEKTQGTSQINNVNRAIDLAGIATTVDADLKQAHQVGTNIDVLRQNEQNWYNQQVKSLATTLSASQLSDADSQSVNGAINAAEQTIQGQINSAQNADDLVAMHSSAVTNFANLTVQVKQAQARYTIIATAADQVAAINNDASLTKSGTTGKDAQTSQVNCQRDSLLTSITSAQTTDQVATILSNGVTALEGIHQSSAQTFDQQQSAANTNATAAETAVSKSISDANSNQKISADQNTQLTGVVSQATNDFNAAIKAAKNADDINAAVNQLNTTLANAQLTLQKNQSTNAVNQAAQTVETAIDQDPTLDAGQKATQKQAVQAQQQTANQQIENASTTAAAQAIESNFTSTVPQLHIAGQAIADRRANLKQLVATAVAAANRAINNDNTLDSAAKQAQLKQVIDAQTTANKAIDAAQNAADGVQAEVNGVNTISALHQAGPISVSQMKANFLALVESLAGTAKQNIGKATTLTADQVNQVTRDATFVHDLSYLNANDAEDADDFETLSNNVQNLYTTVDIELHQLVGLQAITAAKTAADQAIDGKTTLSDAEKTVQKTQVDGVLANAQTAISQSQSSNDADQAANNGVKAIQAIPTDGQSIQQRATDMIASLNKEADKVKTDINTDASLSTADRQSQEKAVENAVAAGVQQINQATTVQDGVTATQNAVNAIDAVHQPGSLPTQKTAVTNTGVGYLKDLTAAIVQDATLQNTEGSHLTDMVVQARDNFTASIKNAQDADSVNQALTDLNQAVQQIANQQTKYDDIHQLQQTASTTTTKIQTDNTLSAAMEANQLAAVQQQLTTATNAVNAIAIGDSQASAKLSSALATGNQNIANSYQPGTPVADHQAAWQQAINDEAQRVTNAINADPTLTGEQQRQQVASVQAAQSNLLTQIEAVTSVQAGDTAQANGLQALDQLHVAGQPVATQQQTGQTTAAAAIAAEQKNIDDNAANMQPSDKSRLDQAVQAAQQAATTAISQAQKADDITKAQSDLAAKLAGIDLDLSHSVGQEKLNVANTQATNAIQNDPTLTGDAKQAQLQSLAKAYQSALQALTATTSVTDASQVATTGVQTITAVHQAGEDLSVQKKNLIANIQQADKSLKAKIDADNTLSQAQKIQQKQQIDTNEGTAINGINQAADADSAKKLADSTNSANSQVYVPGTPLDGQNGQRAALQNQITAKSQAVVQAINQALQAGTINANQQGSLLQEVNVAVSVATYYANQATNADQLTGAANQLSSDLAGVQYDMSVDIAGYNIGNAYNAALQSISDDPTLSIEEKADQSGTVNAELFRARRLLSATKTMDQVNQISGDETQRFGAIHQNGQPVADRRAGFAEIIADEAANSVQKVSNDNTISAAGKQVLTTAVNYMRDWFINELNQAQDVVSAENMVIDDLSSFRFEQKSLSSAALNKELAYKGVYDGIKTADASINSNKNLTPEHLNDLMNELATLTAATHEKVVDAASLSDTNDLLQSYSQSLAALTLKAKKQDATDQLTAAKNVVDTAIDNDGTLTTKQVADQKAAVDQAASQAMQAIQADNEDQIQNTVTNGLQTIMAAHQPQGSLTTQLPAMDKQIDDATAAATAAINGDATLSTDDKANQIAALNKQANDTKQSMANAANTRSAESIMTNGLNALNQIHQPGAPVTAQKQQATNQGTETTATAKDQVPTDQADTINSAIDVAKQKLIDDLNKAQNKDDINRATAAYNQQVNNLVNIAKAKHEATEQANKTAEDVQNHLPASQKNSAAAAVKQAEKAYHDAIKQATSQEAIDQATKQYHDALNRIVQDATAKDATDQQANAQNSAANAAQANQQEAARHDGGDAQKTSSQATINQNIIDDGIQLAKQIKSGLPLVTDAHYQLAVDQALSQLILALANAKTQADVDRAYANYEQTLRDILAQANQATKNQSGSTPGVLRLPGQLAAGQTDIIHNNLKTTIILSATAATLSAGLVATTPHFKIFKRKERR